MFQKYNVYFYLEILRLYIFCDKFLFYLKSACKNVFRLSKKQDSNFRNVPNVSFHRYFVQRHQNVVWHNVLKKLSSGHFSIWSRITRISQFVIPVQIKMLYLFVSLESSTKINNPKRSIHSPKIASFVTNKYRNYVTFVPFFFSGISAI